MKQVDFIQIRQHVLQKRYLGRFWKHTAFILHLSSLICLSASAETATELFDPAAREYIYGNTPVASNMVTQALEQYPTDEKLQKLKELIEQQQKNQDQQNQDQQNQDQQNQQDQNQDQNKDQQNQNDQQNQDQQNKQNQQDQQDKQNQDQQNQQDQDQQDQQKQDQQNQQDQQQEPQEAQPSPAQPHQAGEMSEEEAQQLLDAMKQNEKDQRLDLRPYLGAPVRVDKDW